MKSYTEGQVSKSIFSKSLKKSHEEDYEKPKIVVGLDIGTTKIATLIGVRNEEGKTEVLGFGKGKSTGVEHGLIHNILKTIEGINTSMQVALSKFECEIDEVYVGIAGRHIKSINYKHFITRINGKNEIIRQKEMDQAIDDLKNISVNPGESIIDVIPQHFIIDSQRNTIDPVGEVGELIEGFYQIITGNEAEIDKIMKCVQGSDLKAKDIILEPIASGLSCLSHDEKTNGVALVDIGGGTTDIAIFLNGKPVYTRVFPIGGCIITRDIASVCRITEETAENLKQRYGTCLIEKSNKNNFISIPQPNGIEAKQISETYLAQIINARVESGILNEVKKAILESGYYDKLTKGIVLTGGGSGLRHIKDLFYFSLNLPVRIGLPEMGISSGLFPELKNPIYATGLGLLKYGAEGLNEMSVNSAEEKLDAFVTNSKGKKRKTAKEKEKKASISDNNFIKSVQKFLSDILEKTM